MKGKEYSILIASYVVKNFDSRGIKVYREVNIGKSIIGKNRRVDLLIVDEVQDKAFAIECKFQDSQGTVDEKIPYALQDMDALQIGGCLCYAGSGFSKGVLHMLQGSEIACHCYPKKDLSRSTETIELDHQLALHFKWWDVLVGKKNQFFTIAEQID